MKNLKKNSNLLIKVTVTTLIFNIILTTIKLFGGFFGNAQTLVSDGVNSFTDIIISLILIITAKVASKKADDNHPYGHQKYEGIAYFVLSIIIIIVAFFIEYNAVKSLIEYFGQNSSPEKPKIITIVIAGISIVIKEFLYQINYRAGKKLDSPMIKADATNHRFDVIATTIGLIGLILSQFNLIYFDYIASLIIGLIIIKVAVKMMKEAISFLVDEAPQEEKVNDIKKCILSVEGVLRIDDLKVRMHVTKIYVDVEIGVSANLSLKKSHSIAETVHIEVEKNFSDVIHCMVHVNPVE